MNDTEILFTIIMSCVIFYVVFDGAVFDVYILCLFMVLDVILCVAVKKGRSQGGS